MLHVTFRPFHNSKNGAQLFSHLVGTPPRCNTGPDPANTYGAKEFGLLVFHAVKYFMGDWGRML